MPIINVMILQKQSDAIHAVAYCTVHAKWISALRNEVLLS